jgi:hypothetical protein
VQDRRGGRAILELLAASQARRISEILRSVMRLRPATILSSAWSCRFSSFLWTSRCGFVASGGRSSGYRRANETVPTTSRRTETKLASSAPPDIDTMIVAAAGV